jgi:hypothetical protein
MLRPREDADAGAETVRTAEVVILKGNNASVHARLAGAGVPSGVKQDRIANIRRRSASLTGVKPWLGPRAMPRHCQSLPRGPFAGSSPIISVMYGASKLDLVASFNRYFRIDALPLT